MTTAAAAGCRDGTKRKGDKERRSGGERARRRERVIHTKSTANTYTHKWRGGDGSLRTNGAANQGSRGGNGPIRVRCNIRGSSVPRDHCGGHVTLPDVHIYGGRELMQVRERDRESREGETREIVVS